MRQATASEFSSVRSMPHVEVSHSNGSRVQSVSVHYCGKLVGQKTVFYKRGKPFQTGYEVEDAFLREKYPEFNSVERK